MLSVEEIKKFIDEDIVSEKKKQAEIGQKYYDAEHDILNCRLFYYDADGNLQEDKERSNIKISHPFFTELSDQLAGYMLSFEESPIRAKTGVEKLQDHLDSYFDEDFWSEISDLIQGAYNKGFEYIYAYKNAEDKLTFECADSMGVIEVPAKYADDKQDHVIYWYDDKIEKGDKKIRRIQDWDATQRYFYVQIDGGDITPDTEEEINPRPHVMYQEDGEEEITYEEFGFIPFFRLDNNKKQISGVKPIKPLIDDYDLHACSLSNNLVDFDQPLHVVSGFQGDNLNELQTNLRTKKIVGTDAEGGVEIKTVNIPYQARQAKMELDEKNIYRFGFGLNTVGLKDTSATTNIAIKAAYSLLDMKANRMETRLKKFLKIIVKIVLDEINKVNETDFQIKDVKFEFERSVMTNETENITNRKVEAETQQILINTILSLANALDDETIIKEVCDVMDLDYEEIKDKLPTSEEKALIDAQTALENVTVEE